MNTHRPTDEELAHWLEYGTDLLDHDTQDAILGELIEARRQLAESEERNSNLFDLGNKHLDTIDRVKAVISDIRHWGLPRDASIRYADDLDIAIAGES